MDEWFLMLQHWGLIGCRQNNISYKCIGSFSVGQFFATLSLLIKILNVTHLSEGDGAVEKNVYQNKRTNMNKLQLHNFNSLLSFCRVC